MSDSQDWEAQLAKLKADVDRFGSDLQFHGLSIAAHQVRLGLFDKGLVEVQEQQDYVNSVMNEQKANAIYLEGLLDGYSRMLRAKTRPKKKPEKKGDDKGGNGEDAKPKGKKRKLTEAKLGANKK